MYTTIVYVMRLWRDVSRGRGDSTTHTTDDGKPTTSSAITTTTITTTTHSESSLLLFLGTSTLARGCEKVSDLVRQ